MISGGDSLSDAGLHELGSLHIRYKPGLNLVDDILKIEDLVHD